MVLERIQSGDLSTGGRLPSERSLCEQFGVAHTSVREAIQGSSRWGSSSGGATGPTSRSGCPGWASPTSASTA